MSDKDEVHLVTENYQDTPVWCYEQYGIPEEYIYNNDKNWITSFADPKYITCLDCRKSWTYIEASLGADIGPVQLVLHTHDRPYSHPLRLRDPRSYRIINIEHT